MARVEPWNSALWDGIERFTVTRVAVLPDFMCEERTAWIRSADVAGFYCWWPANSRELQEDRVFNVISFSDRDAAMAFKLRWC